MMRFALAALFVVVPIAAHAQAFGIAMGTTIDALNVVERENSTSHYYEIIPPEPNPIYKEYTVKATPLNGVCYITASNKGWPEERPEILWKQVLAALQSKYGVGEYSSDYQWVWRRPAEDIQYITLNQIGLGWPSVAYFFINKDECDQEPDELVDTHGF